MSERERRQVDELEAALSAIVAGQDVPSGVGEEVRDLANIAAHLLGLPGEDFRARLKADLVGATRSAGTPRRVRVAGVVGAAGLALRRPVPRQRASAGALRLGPARLRRRGDPQGHSRRRRLPCGSPNRRCARHDGRVPRDAVPRDPGGAPLLRPRRRRHVPARRRGGGAQLSSHRPISSTAIANPA